MNIKKLKHNATINFFVLIKLSPEAENAIIDVYKKAIEFLEKAKNLDKEMQYKPVRAYSLYTCCYRIYGADDPKTKEMDALTK